MSFFTLKLYLRYTFDTFNTNTQTCRNIQNISAALGPARNRKVYILFGFEDLTVELLCLRITN